MKKPLIIGAGMAGLIAASMLRGQYDSILEAQEVLPNNHAALLRFRSGVVGEATGIPFRAVRVMKAIHEPSNPVRDSIRYSMKVLGTPAIRSIAGASGEIETRFIAPDDFIPRLADQARGTIAFGVGLSKPTPREAPIISTIPMPTLMAILDYPEREGIDFNSRKGWVVTCDLPGVDICATLYYPGVKEAQYRASITGSRLIIEGVNPEPYGVDLWDIVKEVCFDFGLGFWHMADPKTAEFRSQTYAKILPISEDARKRFIMWASDNFGVYSLGRFATWRPGLMLDDLVNDVRVIQQIISGDKSAPYNKRK